ncbi:MAG TPA: cyclic nucleotide-binding domain-containing protein [Opitutaceae bacterium]|nr:cyclic nucleotide-binding domain-containing protein [Opitutaceae bacterium]
MDLSKCPLFAEFTPVELSALKAITQRTLLEAGAAAFREGEAGDHLVVISTGTLRLTKSGPAGDDEELAVLGSGSYLGEMALFGAGRRSATGTALERTELAFIPYATLQALLEANPPTAAKFYKAIAAGTAKRLRAMNDNVAFLKAFLRARE